jgi:hypothetical protein
VKHNPRCPFCGAPTRAQPFRDRTAYQCTECASLCVGPEVASELLLVMTGTPAGAPVRRAPPRPRSGNMPLVTLGLALVLLLLAAPVAIAVFDAVRTGPATAPPPVEIPVVVTLPPTPVVAPAVLPPPPPAPPAEATAAAPEPVHEPAPEVAPAAPAPPARTARQAIDLGWKRMDANPAGAADAFREALGRDPGNAEAQYGLGYALLQQGDKAGGARHLCASRASAGQELRREVESLLAHNDLKCP